MTSAAAVVVFHSEPTEDEISELAEFHLNDFTDGEATASIDVVTTAPDFLPLCDQDQFNAHLRDGAACLLVIYMEEGAPEDYEVDDE